MVITRFEIRQLVVFAVLTVVALLVLGVYYLEIPSMFGVDRYPLTAELPVSGGLYPTANVTYRGITIGKVTDVEPTPDGVRVTMSIDTRYQIPIDATANVHSMSAVGEQYLDLVSTGNPGRFFQPGQTITKTTVPSEIGPALDNANRELTALPTDKIGSLLDETAQSVGGLGPALQRLVDSTQATARDFHVQLTDIDDIIERSGPILDSQVGSAAAIERWAHNLDLLAAQAAQRDHNLKSVLSQTAPTADQVKSVFTEVGDTLPQTLANIEVVLDLFKRYHKGVEQYLVYMPQGASIDQTIATPFPDQAALDIALSINQPPPCLSGFIPPSEWRSPADTSVIPVPSGNYCKIPMDTPANNVRGSRNIPCVDVPGKRAASPRECRDPKPYVPAGTNPWFGDPNQILTCPAPGARCDQPVKPGQVIPGPSVNNGTNPAPADTLPPGGSPPPLSNPLQRPNSGSVQCDGQQPNPCVYKPGGLAAAVYLPQSGELIGPDGVKYSVDNSVRMGDDGWKEMLGPAPGADAN